MVQPAFRIVSFRDWAKPMHGNKRRNQPWPRIRQRQPGDAGFLHAGSSWRLRGGMYSGSYLRSCVLRSRGALTPRSIIPSSTRQMANPIRALLWRKALTLSPSTPGNTEMGSQCLGPGLHKRPLRSVRPSFSRHGSVAVPNASQRPALLGLGRDASWRRTD